MRSPIVFVFAVLLACAATSRSYNSRLASVTSYSVQTPESTTWGVKYGGPLDPVVLDTLVARVSACLARIPEPSPEAKVVMDCPDRPLRREVDPALFDVMVAHDWRPSAFDRNEQVFPCHVDPQLCRDKGLEPSVEKPCQCRATVQGGRTIIVTPNLKLFPAELVRLVTACNYVWEPALSECAAP